MAEDTSATGQEDRLTILMSARLKKTVIDVEVLISYCKLMKNSRFFVLAKLSWNVVALQDLGVKLLLDRSMLEAVIIRISLLDI